MNTTTSRASVAPEHPKSGGRACRGGRAGLSFSMYDSTQHQD